MIPCNFKKQFFLVLLFIISVSAQCQVITGKLKHRNSNNPAKNFKIIIVPRTAENERITEQNFFYGDDNQQLDRMQAKVAFTNEEGIYFFKGLLKGRYILKVCDMYGTEYKFKITREYSALKIKDLDVSYSVSKNSNP